MVQALSRSNARPPTRGPGGLKDTRPAHSALSQKGVRLDNLAIVDSPENAMGTPLGCLPASMYATMTNILPMSEANIETDFSEEINTFAIKVTSTVANNTSNNLLSTSTSRSPFLAREVGIVIATDFEAGSIDGQAIDAPDLVGGLPVNNTEFTGDIPFNAQSDNRPATFTYGRASWEAAWNFLSAYRLQMFLGGRFKVLDELARHIGSIECNFRAQGFGSSNRPIFDQIRNGNDQQRAIASGMIFQTINTQVVGATSSGVLPPLTQVSTGGPVFPGLFRGGFFPIRPMLFLPGMPTDIQFVREVNENTYYPKLLQALGNTGPVTLDQNLNDRLGPSGSEIGYCVDWQFKYSTLQIGILYRGCELTARACMDWYYQFGWPYQDLINSSDLTVLRMNAMAQHIGLRGLPTPINPREGKKILSGVPDSLLQQMMKTEKTPITISGKLADLPTMD